MMNPGNDALYLMRYHFMYNKNLKQIGHRYICHQCNKYVITWKHATARKRIVIN